VRRAAEATEHDDVAGRANFGARVDVTEDHEVTEVLEDHTRAHGTDHDAGAGLVLELHLGRRRQTHGRGGLGRLFEGLGRAGFGLRVERDVEIGVEQDGLGEIGRRGERDDLVLRAGRLFVLEGRCRDPGSSGGHGVRSSRGNRSGGGGRGRRRSRGELAWQWDGVGVGKGWGRLPRLALAALRLRLERGDLDDAEVVANGQRIELREAAGRQRAVLDLDAQVAPLEEARRLVETAGHRVGDVREGRAAIDDDLEPPGSPAQECGRCDVGQWLGSR